MYPQLIRIQDQYVTNTNPLSGAAKWKYLSLEDFHLLSLPNIANLSETD